MAHKNSRDISRDIWNFSRHLKFTYLIHDFTRAPPKRSSAERWLGNTSLRVDAYFLLVNCYIFRLYVVNKGCVKSTVGPGPILPSCSNFCNFFFNKGHTPTNAIFIKLDKVLKFTLKITSTCSYMFRSTTIIREPSPEPG